jgi:hypothetical protein
MLLLYVTFIYKVYERVSDFNGSNFTVIFIKF